MGKILKAFLFPFKAVYKYPQLILPSLFLSFFHFLILAFYFGLIFLGRLIESALLILSFSLIFFVLTIFIRIVYVILTKQAFKKQIKLKKAFRIAHKRIIGLFACYFLIFLFAIGIAIFFALISFLVKSWIPLIFLVLASFFLLPIFYLIDPVYVLGKQGIIESLKICVKLGFKNFFYLLAFIFLNFSFLFLAQLPIFFLNNSLLNFLFLFSFGILLNAINLMLPTSFYLHFKR